MKIEIKTKIKEFQTIIGVISNVNTESMMSFDKTGVLFKIVDPAATTLLNIKLDKGFFDKYEVEKDVSFNIDFGIMSKIVNSMKKGFTMIDEDADLVFQSPTGNLKRCIRKYIGVKDERPKPNPPYTNSYEIDVEEFFDHIKTMEEAGTVVKIDAGKDIIMTMNGTIERIEVKIENGKQQKNELVYLGLDIVDKLAKIGEVIKKATIKVTGNCPFYFEGKDKNIDVDFFVAARMEDAQ